MFNLSIPGAPGMDAFSATAAAAPTPAAVGSSGCKDEVGAARRSPHALDDTMLTLDPLNHTPELTA
jgi:hypothetical protein